jgi:hypothetical protein
MIHINNNIIKKRIIQFNINNKNIKIINKILIKIIYKIN